MNIEYSETADALDVSFKQGEAAKSEEVEEGVVLSVAIGLLQ